MRGSNNSSRAILATVVAIAAFTISSSSTKAPDRTSYSGRLISIQELQTDFGDMCYWEPDGPPEKDCRVTPVRTIFLRRSTIPPMRQRRAPEAPPI